MTATAPAPELTVLGEIAKGGMGTVELARMVDAAGESLVAVKRMHPEHARDLDFVRMFRDEIWLMGALRHPNIVSLVGWGEDDGGPYLVMEYVDGVALGRIAGVGRRAEQPMPERLVAYAAARAAEGLAAAHELCDDEGHPLEIVHRDVTPSNILVSFDGGVLVTDFGIAKAAGKSSHTRTGIIKGKIAYMSPEYSVRRPVDGRSDLYSLGVVMYEILTGELPFAARTDFELLKKVAYSPAPSIADVAPELDTELAAIIDRLLAKDPGDRPRDGHELAAILDAWAKERAFAPDVVRLELASYAGQHAGKKHKKLMRLLDPDADTVPDDGSGPKRPKFITLGTRTFTLFDPHPPTQSAVAPIPVQRRAERERPRTRKVAVSDFPPANAPVAVPVSAPRASAPSIPDDERLSQPPARPSQPPPARLSQPGVSSRDDTVRTRARRSIPPGVGLTPVEATRALRAHSSAVLGGVVAGSAVALLLIVGTVVSTLGRSQDAPRPAASAAPPAKVEQPVPSATQSVAVPEPPPPAPPPSAEVAPPASTSAKKPPAPPPTGKRPRPPVKVSRPPKRKPPCTPTSFDYPACLSH